MTSKVLLAYASKYGSTREVADAIAKTLREKGLDVEMQQAGEVRSLKEYRAVILGAPLYLYRWHKHALRFLKRHEKNAERTSDGRFRDRPFIQRGRERMAGNPRPIQEGNGQIPLAQPGWI